MDEQKTLTLDFIKSLMEPAYTLIWTDYNDNLDNHCGLIQKCLDSKSREHLWEKADEWYSDAEWEAVREIIAKLKEECAVFHDFDGKRSMTSSMNTKMKSVTRFTAATIRTW